MTQAVQGFVATHQVALHSVANKQSQLLELGALMLVGEHYRRNGYQVSPERLVEGKLRVKLTSRGYPWNFSFLAATDAEASVEIHSNLAVHSTHGAAYGTYVLDVAVMHDGSVPNAPVAGYTAASNDDLVTLGEVKRLVVFPMLLAHFVGIVHELLPSFVHTGKRPYGFAKQRHFLPALMTLGYLHGTCAAVQDGFNARKYLLGVIPSIDLRLTQLADDADAASPFPV